MENFGEIGDDTTKENHINILRKELEIQMQSVHDERDVEKINKIIEELETLEPSNLSSSTDEQLKDFQNFYLLRALEDMHEFEGLTSKEMAKNKATGKEITQFRFPKVRFAAVLSIIILSSSSAIVLAAFGMLNPIIEWTYETFDRKYNAEESISPIATNNPANSKTSYESYDDIAKTLGIPIYKPTYLNENYELVSFDFFETDVDVSFFVRYENSERTISYDIIVNKASNASFNHTIEKTPHAPKIYTYNNIDFYIMQNENWHLVTWDYLGVIYTASGFDSEEDVMEFIETLEM